MPQKNIMWISRHALWTTQIGMLKSLHGKRTSIRQENIRFEDFEHFIDFLKQHKNDYFIYAVIKDEWRLSARKLGYSLGIIHRPENTKHQGKRKQVFNIEYFVTEKIIHKKRKGHTFNSKGYFNPGKKRKK